MNFYSLAAFAETRATIVRSHIKLKQIKLHYFLRVERTGGNSFPFQQLMRNKDVLNRGKTSVAARTEAWKKHGW